MTFINIDDTLTCEKSSMNNLLAKIFQYFRFMILKKNYADGNIGVQ